MDESIISGGRLRKTTLDQIKELLRQEQRGDDVYGLYTEEQFEDIIPELLSLAEWLAANNSSCFSSSGAPRFSESDVLCISYIDHIADDGREVAARRLVSFFNDNLSGLYSHLHVLPHFPSPIIHPDVSGASSRADGGFEIMNYRMDEKYGDPDDLQEMNAALVMDFVINHISSKSEWFQKFLNDDPEYKDFFVQIPEDQLEELDISEVFRPRPHYPVFSFSGEGSVTKHVWCTFSSTQVDLEIRNPRVFTEIITALVKDFIGKGAVWVRLDAVGYLVKMLGIHEGDRKSSCFGIEETHNILKAINLFLKDTMPDVSLVPEVNATRNVIATYYGENGDEGHMAYDFPAAPLSLYAIYSEDATAVMDWARSHVDYPDKIGLAFTSSHDGIGLLPVYDLMSGEDGSNALDFILQEVEARGGVINFKSKVVEDEELLIPYEICITWLQAILSPDEMTALLDDSLPEAEIDVVAMRFIASHSFVYSVPHCVPADYMGAITGLLNNDEVYEKTGHGRDKNRGQIDRVVFEEAISKPETSYEKLVNRIFDLKKQMIEARQSSPAFSPYATCKVGVAELVADDEDVGAFPVYSVMRSSTCGEQNVITLTNCSSKRQKINIAEGFVSGMRDLFSGAVHESPLIELEPYQVLWLGS